jgi:hypothetical protein
MWKQINGRTVDAHCKENFFSGRWKSLLSALFFPRMEHNMENKLQKVSHETNYSNTLLQELFESIPEVLTFYPTEEDMLDFPCYMERLEKICQSGCCKVIPPSTPCKTSDTPLYQKMVQENKQLDVSDQ